MNGPDLVARSRFLANVSLFSAVSLVALVLLLFLTVDHTTVSGSFIILWGMFLLLSAVILGVALMYLAMTRDLETGPPAGAAPLAVQPTPQAGPREAAPDALLAVLQDDDRSVYRRIVDAGGTVLQAELVIPDLLPAPKVSRILDRLEARGLVVRRRHGMSNRILLSEGWRNRGP